jgi:hypothetical protein
MKRENEGFERVCVDDFLWHTSMGLGVMWP